MLQSLIFFFRGKVYFMIGSHFMFLCVKVLPPIRSPKFLEKIKKLIAMTRSKSLQQVLRGRPWRARAGTVEKQRTVPSHGWWALAQQPLPARHWRSAPRLCHLTVSIRPQAHQVHTEHLTDAFLSHTTPLHRWQWNHNKRHIPWCSDKWESVIGQSELMIRRLI